MQFEQTELKGVLICTPDVHTDERGFFLERYNKNTFADSGIMVDFVQDNHSRSKKGVLRGMHFQNEPFAQDKLVWVTSGAVYDVVVDIRKSSETYGKWLGYELSAESKQMLFVPKGFAHGFLVLEDDTDFQYKVSHYHAPEHENGLLWNDVDIGIEWPIAKPIITKKDTQYQSFSAFESKFE